MKAAYAIAFAIASTVVCAGLWKACTERSDMVGAEHELRPMHVAECDREARVAAVAELLRRLIDGSNVDRDVWGEENVRLFRKKRALASPKFVIHEDDREALWGPFAYSVMFDNDNYGNLSVVFDGCSIAGATINLYPY